MNQINQALSTKGICYFEDIYSLEELQSINAAIDPLLASRNQDNRSYVHIDELKDLNLFDAVFSPQMKSLLFSIVNDPVLYHCHIYEIAGNSKRSHIFDETLSGWHRDPDSEYFPHEATHISIFVYLSHVGDEDGAFEFIPQDPLHWLWKNTPCVSVTGKPGFSFAWNRAFFHRASPNRSPVRRRLLKISIQPNRFINPHFGNPHFQRALSLTPEGNLDMDLLLGRYQGALAPSRTGSAEEPKISMFEPTRELGIANTSLLKVQLRNQARALKRWLMRTPTAVAQYD